MKWNCDKCGIEMDIDGDLKTDFAGTPCTMAEYIEKTKNNQHVFVVCDECLEKMPDAGHFFDEGNYRTRGLN